MGDVSVLKLASPLYVALRLWLPAGNEGVVKVATPALSVPVPRVAAPFLNVTVPLGVPAEEVTVAVSFTDWPNVAGFTDEVSVAVVVALFTVWTTMGEVLPAQVL